jgi:hypothetical protein
MFILSKDKKVKSSLQFMWNELSHVNSNFTPIEEFKFGSFYLYWFSARPQDQLNVYANGFIIGKSSFEEDYKPDSIEKIEFELPESLHPLLQSTIIEIDGDDQLNIIPNGITPIYYSEQNTVSDYQLLIAKYEDLKPDVVLVQTLCGIGYMPGNLTLFDSVQKIPYLFQLSLPSLTLTQIEIFTPERSNDDKLVQQLINVIPEKKEVSLSMSGGMDSRFVLGILLKKGISPELVTMKGNELEIVQNLSKALNLKLEIKKSTHVNAYDYSLMTDGRIYFRGGNYSQMVNSFHPNKLLYNGLSILPMNENSFASAWKKPGKLETIYEDLIDYALIQRVPDLGFQSFTSPVPKADMKSFLSQKLSFGKNYFKFKTRKQWGIWFYHLHRGLTWTPAHLADLSFYIYPVFILSDKKASEIGISSTAFENYNKERLRKMNQKLFKTARIDYSDRRKFGSQSSFILPFSKIYNEYFRKFFKRFQQLKKDPSQNNNNWFEEVKGCQADTFRNYFKEDFETTLSSQQTRFNEKRTAVTLNHILLFLEK